MTELEEETENKNKVNKVNKLNNKKVKQEVQQEKDTTDEDFQFKFQSHRTPSPQHIKLKLPMSAIGECKIINTGSRFLRDSKKFWNRASLLFDFFSIYVQRPQSKEYIF